MPKSNLKQLMEWYDKRKAPKIDRLRRLMRMHKNGETSTSIEAHFVTGLSDRCICSRREFSCFDKQVCVALGSESVSAGLRVLMKKYKDQ